MEIVVVIVIFLTPVVLWAWNYKGNTKTGTVCAGCSGCSDKKSCGME